MVEKGDTVLVSIFNGEAHHSEYVIVTVDPDILLEFLLCVPSGSLSFCVGF